MTTIKLHFQLPRHFILIVFILCANCLDASQAGKDFNDADAELNTAYNDFIKTVVDPQQKVLFVHAQSAWLKYRDENVALFADRYPESKGALFYNMSLVKERTTFLKALLKIVPSEDPMGNAVFEDKVTSVVTTSSAPNTNQTPAVISLGPPSVAKPNGPSEKEAKEAFLRKWGKRYPYEGLPILQITFGEIQEANGKKQYPGRVIFRQPSGENAHTDMVFSKNPYGEWDCQMAE